MSKFKLPTEVLDLPSKGLLYPKDNKLSSGQIEIKYMTAKEEDILSNSSYISKGIVLDKLFESLIVTKINYNDLLLGDKNAIMIAARVLGYGKNYSFKYGGENYDVDLSKLDNKKVDEKLYNNGNSFEFTLPSSGNKVKFKLLTHGDEIEVNKEVASLKRLKKESSASLSTRMKYIITSVNGDRETATIRQFVDQGLLAQDARALREEYARVQPDVEFKVYHVDEDGVGEDIDVPVTINFFWPDA
jgi:hypothetical protein